MTDEPLDLDTHRDLSGRKAVDLRRALAEAESHTRHLRERQADLEQQVLATAATSWPEAAAKVRYLLNKYAASLTEQDTRHRALIAAVLADVALLTGES